MMGGLLWVYKRGISPLLHAAAGVTGACRFQPTCSEYAALAVATHGPLQGSWLAVCRVLRCHPLCRGGFDPVPGTGYDGATTGHICENGGHHL
jgi:putative membrane protein insertion efficiency factor